jgi:hypothetical protein
LNIVVFNELEIHPLVYNMAATCKSL